MGDGRHALLKKFVRSGPVLVVGLEVPRQLRDRDADRFFVAAARAVPRDAFEAQTQAASNSG